MYTKYQPLPTLTHKTQKSHLLTSPGTVRNFFHSTARTANHGFDDPTLPQLFQLQRRRNLAPVGGQLVGGRPFNGPVGRHTFVEVRDGMPTKRSFIPRGKGVYGGGGEGKAFIVRKMGTCREDVGGEVEGRDGLRSFVVERDDGRDRMNSSLSMGLSDGGGKENDKPDIIDDDFEFETRGGNLVLKTNNNNNCETKRNEKHKKSSTSTTINFSLQLPNDQQTQILPPLLPPPPVSDVVVTAEPKQQKIILMTTSVQTEYSPPPAVEILPPVAPPPQEIKLEITTLCHGGTIAHHKQNEQSVEGKTSEIKFSEKKQEGSLKEENNYKKQKSSSHDRHRSHHHYSHKKPPKNQYYSDSEYDSDSESEDSDYYERRYRKKRVPSRRKRKDKIFRERVDRKKYFVVDSSSEDEDEDFGEYAVSCIVRGGSGKKSCYTVSYDRDDQGGRKQCLLSKINLMRVDG